MISRLLSVAYSLRIAFAAKLPPDFTHRFYGMPVIRWTPGSRLNIGRRFTALSLSRYNEIGVIQPVVLSTLDAGAEIIIHDDVGVSGCSISSRIRVEIGAGTLIGSGALIMDHDAHALPLPGDGGDIGAAPVTIGRHVFIGARAIVLKGVSIGDHAVIGAGAVVTRDVPAHARAAGNPARILPSTRFAA